MSLAAHEAGDYFAKTVSKEFAVTYQVPEKSPSGRSTVYIEGPEEFLEHGSLVFTFDEQADWRAKNWHFDDDGRILLRGPRKLKFVRKIMQIIADNTSFYLAHGLQSRAQFLTDMPGETFLLEGINSDEQVSANSSIMRALDHTLPILADFSFDEILQIRGEERESFAAYREAISATTADVFSRPISEREAQQLFKEKIEPQLSRMQREIIRDRKKQARRVAVGLGSLVAGIGIGAFAGLPLIVGAPIAALGTAIGSKVLTKAVEEVCEHGADIRQQNDLYFLVKLLNGGPLNS